MALPPGPSQSRIVQTVRWIREPVRFMEECRERYGDAFTLDMYGVGRLAFFASPAAIRQIFTADDATMHAGEANELLGTLLGSQSVLLLDEAPHLRQRRLLLPPFHGERMQTYATVMRDVTDASLDEWPLDQAFALHGPLQEITLGVILRAVFGLEDGARKDALSAALSRLLDRTQTPWVLLPMFRHDLPGTPYRKFLRLRAATDALIYDEIARRRAQGDAGGTDVFSMLLAARHEDGTAMSDAELRDELMTLLVAGHETTASTLAWVFELLLEHPEAMRRARAELARVVGDGPLELGHLTRLEYLDAIVRETLRLRPILPIVGRVTKRPVAVGGFDVPVGSIISACVYLAQHAGAAYPEPEAFRPERWLGTRPDPYSWLPFGGGVRRCIGMAFAQYEMKIVLAEVLLRASFVRASDGPAKLVRRGITFVPEGGVRVVLRSRAPHAAPAARAAQHAASLAG